MHKHPLFWLPNLLTFLRCVMAGFVAWAVLYVAAHEVTMLELARNPNLPSDAQEAHVGASAQFRRFWGGLGFLVFSLAAATDWLDGVLARRFNAESRFGRLLDPIADKLIVGLPLVAVTIASGYALPVLVPVAIILGRDVFVTLLRFAGLGAERMAVQFLSKVKTFILMIVVACLFLSMALLEANDPRLPVVLTLWLGGVWLAALLSLVTGLRYVVGIFARPAKPA